MKPGRIDQRGRFNLTGGVSTMSGSPGAARDSAAFVPLVLQIRCFGVCNRWAKNAPIGIDRGTADWLRDDARLGERRTDTRAEQLLQSDRDQICSIYNPAIAA